MTNDNERNAVSLFICILYRSFLPPPPPPIISSTSLPPVYPCLPAGGLGEHAVYHVPGLCLPKGLDALLPVYQRALMHGSAEEREAAATGIGELIELTSADALRPLYVKITGPLIRIMADKFPWGVKAAILSTLAIVITSGGAALKPFQPQLQTTFVKALSDPTQAVRSRGAAALGKLMAISTRIDPLLNELAAGVAGNTGGIQESMLEAVIAVMTSAGDKVTPPIRAKAVEAIEPLTSDGDHTIRCLAGSALGAVLRHADVSLSGDVLDRLCLSKERDDDSGGSAVAVDPEKDGRCAAVKGALKHGAIPGCGPHAASLLAPHIAKAAVNEQAAIRVWAARSAGHFLSATAVPEGVAGEEAEAAAASFASASASVISTLAKLLGDASADVRKAALDACKRYGRHSPRHATSGPSASTLLPPVIAIASRESSNMIIRTAADRALMYLAQVHGSPALASAALAALPAGGEDGKWLANYASRFLKKMSADSDEEDGDAE